MTSAGTVVLGVGSPLMGDDGVGVEVVDVLRDRWAPDPGLAWLDGGTWGMRALPYIEDAERLLVVDAIRNGGQPGSLVRLEGEGLPRFLRQKVSPHQIDLSEVLAVAELRGTLPPALVALGVEPDRVELHDGLSHRVQAAVPELMQAIHRQLQAWGHDLRPREAHPCTK